MLPASLQSLPKKKLVNLPPLSRIESNALLNDQRGKTHCLRDAQKFIQLEEMSDRSPPQSRHSSITNQGEKDDNVNIKNEGIRSPIGTRPTFPWEKVSEEEDQPCSSTIKKFPKLKLLRRKFQSVDHSADEKLLDVSKLNVTFGMPTTSAVVDENDASGSQIAIPDRIARRASVDDEIEEDETVVTATNFIPQVEKNYDPEDLEARMPTEKSSLKSSLKVEDTILRLNIGGSSYRIRTRSILKYGPTTLLGRLVRMDHDHRRQWADGYFEETDEYFFERVPRYFDAIFDFYASGKLHVPKDLCFEKFMSELRFWAVSRAKMDDCCSSFAQFCLTKMPSEQPEKDHFIGLRCAKVRRRLWLVLEGHSNSRWWKFFEITSTSFVVLSITALIMGSIPDFQVPEKSIRPAEQTSTVVPGARSQIVGQSISSSVYRFEAEDVKPEMVEHPVFNYVENVCVIYFTIEYLLRFWVAPRKLPFVKEFLNIIDLLAIAPFIFEVILFLVGLSGENIRKVRWAFLTVRLLRVLRVVRIAKLGRFSPGLANFALTLRKSKKQMQMVAIILLTVMIFFSTLVYFLERDEPNTTFTSIPAAFWWVLFSQTKYVPTTSFGKLIGGGAILCGAMVISLPITIMINNFLQVVKLREEKVIKRYAQRIGDSV